jgi:hypothetical protein
MCVLKVIHVNIPIRRLSSKCDPSVLLSHSSKYEINWRFDWLLVTAVRREIAASAIAFCLACNNSCSTQDSILPNWLSDRRPRITGTLITLTGTLWYYLYTQVMLFYALMCYTEISIRSPVSLRKFLRSVIPNQQNFIALVFEDCYDVTSP